MEGLGFLVFLGFIVLAMGRAIFTPQDRVHPL